MEAVSSMSLSDLRESLESSGINMALNSLSEFLGTGDVAEILGIERKGNRLEIPPGVANILVEFIPQYKSARGRLPQMPAMLRSFIQQRTDGGGLVPMASSEFRGSLQITKYGDGAMELLSEIRDILKEKQMPPEDTIYTLIEARRQFPLLSIAVLRGIRVKIGNRLFVRRSDCLRVIQEATPCE
jgi:hypothetical protein